MISLNWGLHFQTNFGSPLVLAAETEDRTLVGLLSFVGECGNPSLPGVYVDLASYREWINETVTTPEESTTTTTEEAGETTTTEETPETTEGTTTEEGSETTESTTAEAETEDPETTESELF